MSKIDDERLGLGWEVWFLLAILGVGGILGLLVPNIIGVGFDAVATHTAQRDQVMLEWPRVAVGSIAAAGFATLAIRLFRTTEWQLPVDLE